MDTKGLGLVENFGVSSFWYKKLDISQSIALLQLTDCQALALHKNKFGWYLFLPLALWVEGGY